MRTYGLVKGYGQEKGEKKARTPELAQDETPEHLELERKYTLADLGRARRRFPAAEDARGLCRAIFNEVATDTEGFPDRSALMGRHDVPRSRETKETRSRIYFADAGFVIIDNKFEIRLQLDSGVLMIKEGNGADAGSPTMKRTETAIKMVRPQIGSLADIKENSGKKPPKSLRKLFKDDGADETLYPVVETESVRSKLIYYRAVTYEDRHYLIAFEFAQDEGVARPLLSDAYEIDQFELEVKRVIDAETGIDVLDHPGELGLTLDEVKDGIIETALDEEEALLMAEFGLDPVYESKPKEGFRRARKAMETGPGMEAARAARERHLGNPVWPVPAPVEAVA